jgi:3-hydroxyisobutyrate dehydrogenase-like beta-hydroxyacid dehydrogenase
VIRVGFIGLGSQGAPMARRIVEAGYPLTIWARRPETLEAFAETPAQVATTPAELAAHSDVVGICVVADMDVEDVVLGANGVLAGMAPGGIIAIHSTVRPQTCRNIAAQAEARGVSLIDAPVSGGAPAVAEGRLLVMVGGDPETLEKARPVLATYGNPILHLGPLGSGQIAKVLNNFVFTGQLAVALETFRFADQLGIDQSAVAEVLANGSGGSRAAAIVAGGGFGTDRLKQVAETLLAKDVGIMADIASQAGVEEPPHLAGLARAALRMYSTD